MDFDRCLGIDFHQVGIEHPRFTLSLSLEQAFAQVEVRRRTMEQPARERTDIKPRAADNDGSPARGDDAVDRRPRISEIVAHAVRLVRLHNVDHVMVHEFCAAP